MMLATVFFSCRLLKVSISPAAENTPVPRGVVSVVWLMLLITKFSLLRAALRYIYDVENKSNKDEDFKTYPSMCSMKVTTEKMKKKVGKFANQQTNNVYMEFKEHSKFNKMIK